MTTHPLYWFVIRDAKEYSKDGYAPLFLDVGCCMGSDVRKLLFDGYPLSSARDNVVGCDLRQEFLDYGHELYQDGPQPPSPTPVRLFAADLFANAQESHDNTDTLSLSKLKGNVDFMYTGSFFHLFDEPTQKELAGRLILLLNISKGASGSKSIIFGRHQGSATAGYFDTFGTTRYGHSPVTWTEMWTAVLNEAFGAEWVKQNATIEVVLKPLPGAEEYEYRDLVWSVTVQKDIRESV